MSLISRVLFNFIAPLNVTSLLSLTTSLKVTGPSNCVRIVLDLPPSTTSLSLIITSSKITDNLDGYGIDWEQHAASAHKEPLKVLDILNANRDKENVVYVTIAGRSNALSGFVAANSEFPTLGCPPFSDKADMLVNIHSTLQMPSNTPVLTVIDPGNCALAAKRILGA